jgi:hypothetical protein
MGTFVPIDVQDVHAPTVGCGACQSSVPMIAHAVRRA